MKRKINKISSDTENSNSYLDDEFCSAKDQELKVEKGMNDICKNNNKTFILRDGIYKDSWIWKTVEDDENIPGVVKKIKLCKAERKGKTDAMGPTKKIPKTDVVLTFICYGEHKNGKEWQKKVSIGFSIKKDNFYTYQNWIGFEQSKGIFGYGKLKHLQKQTIPLFCEQIKKSGKVSFGYCLMVKSTESKEKKKLSGRREKMLTEIFRDNHSFTIKEIKGLIDRLLFNSLQENDNCQALYKKTKCKEDLKNLDVFLNSRNIIPRKIVLEPVKVKEIYNKLYVEVRSIYIENDLPSTDLLAQWKPNTNQKITPPNIIEIEKYYDLKQYGNWEPTEEKVNTAKLLQIYENEGFCFSGQSFLHSNGKRRRAVKNIGKPCINVYKQKSTYSAPQKKTMSINFKRSKDFPRFYFKDKNKVIVDITHSAIDTNYVFKLLYDNYVEEWYKGKNTASFVKPREIFVKYIKEEISQSIDVCEDMFNDIRDVIIKEGLIEYSKIQKGDKKGENNTRFYVITHKGRIWGLDLRKRVLFPYENSRFFNLK